MKCENCKHGRKLYYSTNEKEIEEIRKKEVVKKTKLFCKISKELAIQAPEKLLRYVKEVNPFDVSYEDWNEGFLREAKNVQESEKAEFYCLVDPFEPNEVSEFTEKDIEECSEFKKAKKP